MASRFNVIYPQQGRLGLGGGLNTKIDRQILLDNESPDCQNVVFGAGSVETRGGTTQVNTAAVGSFACDGLYTRHDSGGAETMVAWWDGTLFDLQGTSFISVTSAKCIFTANTRVYATEYEDYIYFSNGGTNPYKWNGAEFTRMSADAPTSACTASTGTGSAVSGDIQYKVVFVNSNLVETDVGPASDTLTVDGQNINISSIPVAPQSHGINSRRIYRLDSSSTVTTYRRVGTINDNTTTTFTDDVTTLGADAPTDNGKIASTATAMLYHQGRIFYIDSGDFFVKYSEVGNPYVFPALNFLRIGDTSGDIPQTLGILDNSIVVGCKRSTWIIYMPDTTASNWIQLRIKTSYGSRSPFSVLKYNNRLLMGATESDNFVGFSSIAGTTVEPTATLMTVSATGSDLTSNVIEPDMFDVVDAQVPNISGIVYKNKAYISLTKTSGATNNRIYVFDFSIENLAKKQKFAWSVWTGLNAAQFTILDGNLYYADDNETGLVYTMLDDTYNDNGSAIDSYYWTKELGGQPGHENFVKDFRWLHVLHELSGDFFMNINTRVDSSGGGGNVSQILLDPGASLWGTFSWNADNWSPGGEQAELKHPLGALSPSKRIQFKFSNQNKANQSFKVIGLNLDYNIRGRR